MESEQHGQVLLSNSQNSLPELSIVHNHCAIELAIDNAIYALNVKMVFGNTRELHHLRHRSHEPQTTQRVWDYSRQPRTAIQASSDTDDAPAEMTPLDVESPNQSLDSRLRFFPSVLAHRSTPSTPAEESRYQKRIGDSSGLPLDLKGLAFTLLNQAEESEERSTLVPPSSQRTSSSMLGDGMSEDTQRVALTATPPSTPSFQTPSLGSPALTFSARGTVKDASGTRRMMLKRKSSSFLRTQYWSSQPYGENGSWTSSDKDT